MDRNGAKITGMIPLLQNMPCTPSNFDVVFLEAEFAVGTI